MSTLEVVKLKQAGETVSFTVESCGKVGVGQYPEVEFIGEGMSLVMPQKSADRQLERAGLTYASAVGKRLRFSRDENKTDASKPYWGITVLESEANNGGGVKSAQGNASQGDARPKAGTSPVSAPQPGASSAEFSDPRYEAITDYVLVNIVPRYKNRGIICDASATAAIVATLYINASRHA